MIANADRDELAARLADAGVPVAPVVNPRVVVENEQHAARGFYEPVVHPVAGEVRIPGFPARWDGRAAPWHHRAAPLLGEHNEEILRGAGRRRRRAGTPGGPARDRRHAGRLRLLPSSYTLSKTGRADDGGAAWDGSMARSQSSPAPAVGSARATRSAWPHEGASVVVADIKSDGAERVAGEIADGGGRALAVTLDIGDDASPAAMAKAAIGEFGGIDFLVNNAAIYGGMRNETLLEVDFEYYQHFMNVNLQRRAAVHPRVLPVDGRARRRRDRQPVVDRGVDGGRVLLDRQGRR